MYPLDTPIPIWYLAYPMDRSVVANIGRGIAAVVRLVPVSFSRRL